MADPSTYRPRTGDIPTSPGVYRFSDPQGRVIYVGKAKNLRNRLTNYFQDLANLHPRTQQMVTTASAVQWTVVRSEVEALTLEFTWIKEFNPRFNVMFKDDKSYPYLAVSMGERFPRVQVTRERKRAGSAVFWSVHASVGDSRDDRSAAARLPDALVFGGCVSACEGAGAALPARLHRQVRGPVRGAYLHGGASRARRGAVPVHGGAQRARVIRDLEEQMRQASAELNSSAPRSCAMTSRRCARCSSATAVVLDAGRTRDVFSLVSDAWTRPCTSSMCAAGASRHARLGG